MSWKRLFLRRRVYGELSNEIREHLWEKEEELVAGGMLRTDAQAHPPVCVVRTFERSGNPSK
jgi:hypothetical protein